MKTTSESPLARTDPKVEVARWDEQTEPEMVELGKVSDTQGAPVWGKSDNGNGFMTF